MDKNEDSNHNNIQLDNKRVSEILQDFLHNYTEQRITVSNISNALADRAFALLMLLFALPNLIPIPLPGISIILGVPMIFLSCQLMMGRKAPWFPKWISKQSFQHNDIETVVDYAMPYLKRLEQILKPRLGFLLCHCAERIIALICLVMSVMITLPIPFGNWFPALTICLFALAILERDGMFVLLGVISAFISTILVSAIILTALKAIMFLLEKAFN